MTTILSILNELESTTKSKEKLEILKNHTNNELLKRVLFMALNPSTNYYIKDIPDAVSKPTHEAKFIEWGLDEIQKLSNRELTGNDATDHLKVVLESVSSEDATVLKRVVLKDLRCGVGASTTNKAFSGLIPEYPYCRCSLLSDLKTNNLFSGYLSQLKLDGEFININVTENNEVEYFTRNGNSFNSPYFEKISNALLKIDSLRNHQLHGELLVKRNGIILPREEGNGMLNSLLSGGVLENDCYLFLVLWSYVPLDAVKPKSADTRPYKEVYNNLLTMFAGVDKSIIDIVETEIVYTENDVRKMYSRVKESGGEGLVIKDPNMVWKDGTSRQQFKIKTEFVVELEIIGFTKGNNKFSETFGSIMMKSADDLLFVDVSGIKDDVRKYISDNRESFIGKIASVKSNAICNNKAIEGKYSLFLPRLVEIREDKNTANTFEEIKREYANSLDKIKFSWE